MIKFFRRIRQKLLSEGKFRKYLIYALGEILLVVIGILIAVQLNNRNEIRKTQNQANELAAQLYNELLQVKRYHKEFFEIAYDEELRNTEYFLQHWNHLSTDSLAAYRQGEFNYLKNAGPLTGMMGFQFFYDPEFPNYKSAVNDGSISGIQNKAFINLLSLIYVQGHERMSFFEQSVSDIDSDINLHIRQQYAHVFADAVDGDGSPWDEQAYNQFFKQIKTDHELRYLVNDRLQVMKFKKTILDGQVIKRINQAIDIYQNPELSH